MGTCVIPQDSLGDRCLIGVTPDSPTGIVSSELSLCPRSGGEFLTFDLDTVFDVNSIVSEVLL